MVVVAPVAEKGKHNQASDTILNEFQQNVCVYEFAFKRYKHM